jgi:peptidoglycan/LPS O-acetylase OafA/YrhL
MLKTFDFRNNAIGALRLFFASVVILAHAYPIGDFGEDPAERWSHGVENIGYLAVACFFVLSGFLIARSAERSRSVGRFLWHRFLRIFPAFWTCLVVTVVIIAPCIWLVEHRDPSGYVSAPLDNPLRYIVVNADLTMRQYGIGGLLEHQPLRSAFNGSLWTLRFEFACYALVALLALPWLRSQRVVAAAVFGLLYAVYAIPIAFHGALPPPWSFEALLRGSNRHGAELFVYFFAGVVAYQYRDRLPLNRTIGVAALVVAILALPFPIYALVLPIALPAATLWLARDIPIRNIDRNVDLSYGVYIYAFPLQQLAASAGLAAGGFVMFTFVAVLATLAFACGSWFLVERQALKLKEMPVPIILSQLVFRRSRL